jgi:vacuolar-type H+-ATPase subunit I/STV1
MHLEEMCFHIYIGYIQIFYSIIFLFYQQIILHKLLTLGLKHRNFCLAVLKID